MAGDRVTTDCLQPSPWAVTFSVFSKKHIENPPEQKVRRNYALLYRQLHAIHDRARTLPRHLKLPRAYFSASLSSHFRRPFTPAFHRPRSRSTTAT